MTNQNQVRQKQEKYNRSPINGTFELTGRCNLNCKMCYVHVDQKRIQQGIESVLPKSGLTWPGKCLKRELSDYY